MKNLIILIAAIFFINLTVEAQVKTTTTSKRKMFPHFSISPSGGAIFPIQNLKESFKPGGQFGLDLGYRVNKEVGFYAKFGYYFMSSKITGAPVGAYIEGSAGPRYFFTHPKLKSEVFLEGGVGAYNFRQDAYVDNLTQTQVDQISSTKAGVNAGVGGSLALSNAVDILVKSKYHVIFTPNGSSSFLTVTGGLEFRFR
ncbi:MAG: hypothetical protein EHM58_15160 [Ignavibacteriae bacterium]|nr:MAG: hypothetical protein EHM58_15160 [Ignavibacteriota bacterium]